MPGRAQQAISGTEFWHMLANRLYFSDQYSFLYMAMIILNVIIIAWMMSMDGGYDGNMLFLLLQLTVNFVLVAEVTIRLISQRGNFFSSNENIFDVVVMFLSIFATLLYVHPPEVAAAYLVEEEWLDVASALLRISRDGVLFIRLFIFIKNRKKNVIAEEDEVDFSAISEEAPLLLPQGRL